MFTKEQLEAIMNCRGECDTCIAQISDRGTRQDCSIISVTNSHLELYTKFNKAKDLLEQQILEQHINWTREKLERELQQS